MTVTKYLETRAGTKTHPSLKGAPPHRFRKPKAPIGGKGMKEAGEAACAILAGKGMPWE